MVTFIDIHRLLILGHWDGYGACVSSYSSGNYYGVYAINNNAYYYPLSGYSGFYGGNGTSTTSYSLWSGAGPSGSQYYDTGYNGTTYYYVYNNSSSGSQSNAASYGTRPVISLKSGVKTNGSEDQTYLGQICWNLSI